MYKKFLLSALIIGMTLMPAFASETPEGGALSTATPSDYVDDNERFESRKDRDAQMATDSVSNASIPDQDIFGGYATYQEYLEATKTDELTDEQAAEGYSINEYGQLETPDQGEAYTEIIMGGVNPGPNTGYVTVKVTSEATLHEEIYVHVMNLNTAKMYGCNVYEINGYMTDLCLPAGNYIIQEAAPTLDAQGRFYTYNRQFKVDKNSTQILEVVLIDSMAKENAATTTAATEEASAVEQITTNETPEPVNTIQVGTEVEQETKKSIPWLDIIVAIGVIGGIAVALRKLFPSAPKQHTRGFDE